MIDCRMSNALLNMTNNEPSISEFIIKKTMEDDSPIRLLEMHNWLVNHDCLVEKENGKSAYEITVRAENSVDFRVVENSSTDIPHYDAVEFGEKNGIISIIRFHLCLESEHDDLIILSYKFVRLIRLFKVWHFYKSAIVKYQKMVEYMTQARLGLDENYYSFARRFVSMSDKDRTTITKFFKQRDGIVNEAHIFARGITKAAIAVDAEIFHKYIGMPDLEFLTIVDNWPSSSFQCYFDCLFGGSHSFISMYYFCKDDIEEFKRSRCSVTNEKIIERLEDALYGDSPDCLPDPLKGN